MCCSGAATPACISTEHLSRLSLTAKWLDSRDGNGSRACSHYNLSLVSGPSDGRADRQMTGTHTASLPVCPSVCCLPLLRQPIL